MSRHAISSPSQRGESYGNCDCSRYHFAFSIKAGVLRVVLCAHDSRGVREGWKSFRHNFAYRAAFREPYITSLRLLGEVCGLDLRSNDFSTARPPRSNSRSARRRPTRAMDVSCRSSFEQFARVWQDFLDSPPPGVNWGPSPIKSQKRRNE